MAKIKANFVDFICADFPYNISNNHGLTKKNSVVVKADFGEWDKFETPAIYFDFVFRVCEEYKRILKPNGSMVLFFSYRYAGWIAYELERRGLFTFRIPLIFNKTNAQPQYRKNGFRPCFEMGVWLTNDEGEFQRPKTFNFLEQRQMRAVQHYKIGKEGGKQTMHPTEKPEELIGRLIEIFTRPGDIVLDSFGGGGTTGVAAWKRGRHCISIEKEAGFVEMIKRRQARAEREAGKGG